MIYVITHKKADVSKYIDEHYKILHVGNDTDYDIDYLLDSTGDSISHKNKNYCELTGLYWIWKNVQEEKSDITGLVHYRRFFTTRICEILYNYMGIHPKTLSYKTIERDLRRNDIIVPRKKKAFKTVAGTYSCFHRADDLKQMEESIIRVHPEYRSTYRKVMCSHSYYYANMMLCRRELLEQYSEWLFALLDDFESHIDIDTYTDPYQARVFGFISERILQVWIEKNGYKVKERSIFNTEKRGDTFFSINIDRIKRLIAKVYQPHKSSKKVI